MERDNELEGIEGKIKIDEYSEGAGYSVWGSIKEREDYELADNAEYAAIVAGEAVECAIKGVTICKNSNIMLLLAKAAGADEDAKRYAAFLTPCAAGALHPVFKAQAAYKTTPKGLKVQCGVQFAHTEYEMKTALEGLNAAVKFETVQGRDGNTHKRLTVIEIY